MIQKGRKCLCKKCDDCNFFVWFDLREEKNGLPTGLTKREQRCGLFALIDHIPRVAGAIDGLQGGVNEARNRAIETQQIVAGFGQASVQAIESIGQAATDALKRRQIEGKPNAVD